LKLCAPDTLGQRTPPEGGLRDDSNCQTLSLDGDGQAGGSLADSSDPGRLRLERQAVVFQESEPVNLLAWRHGFVDEGERVADGHQIW
jgi:hypothetical protein